MNEQIKELLNVCGMPNEDLMDIYSDTNKSFYMQKFAELIVRECADIVEQAKKSPFVSLDDAKRMSHFVDVTKKKINKHFGVEE